MKDFKNSYEQHSWEYAAKRHRDIVNTLNLNFNSKSEIVQKFISRLQDEKSKLEEKYPTLKIKE